MKVKDTKAFNVSPTQVEYFDRVRRRLLDVPWAQRQELLADLITRLYELTWNTEPEEALGTAGEYARLAREAAGYGPSAPRRFAYVRAWRPRRKILACVALVVMLVVVPAVAFAGSQVMRYQPLDVSSIGGSSSAPFVETSIPTDVEYRRYQPGATVVVDVVVRNHGRFTATVTGVVTPDGFQPIVPVGLRRAAANVRDFLIWQRGAPVQTISVHPGETVYMFVMMKVARQEMAVGGSASQDLPTLKVEVLGVRHDVPIRGSGIGVIKQR